jgi:hypothetical protein
VSCADIVWWERAAASTRRGWTNVATIIAAGCSTARSATAHIIITYDLEGRRLNANADPDFPDAWRQEPYYSQLRQWAATALQRNGQVVAYVGRHTFVILPDRDVDLGIFTDDDYIFIEHLADGSWDARKVNEAEAEELRRADKAPH